MMKTRSLVLLGVVLSACKSEPAHEQVVKQAVEVAPDPSLVIWVPLGDPAVEEAARAREELEARGVRIYLVLPGQVLVTSVAEEAPDSAVFVRLSLDRSWSTRATTLQRESVARAESLLRRPPVATSERGFRDEVAGVEEELAEVERSLADALAVTKDPAVERQLRAQLDALAVEEAELTATPIAGTPPDSRRKYLRGSILVHCLFVESDGTGNEDWTTVEVADELASYEDALLALARVAPAEYHLSFTLDHIPPTDARMRIGHEPTSDVPERTWIVEVLRNLGYDGVITAAGGTQRFERDQIEAHGVREGSVVYVARDAVAPFADFNNHRRTAWPHAYFNSFAITNSGGSGATLIHELMHTFNADDEYAATGRVGYGCKARSSVGHDRAVAAGSGDDSNANQDSCTHFAEHQACLMRSTTMDSTPFLRPIMCWHTRAQIGWRDTASVDVQLTGLPSTTPSSFTPPLVTHIDLRAASLARTFSYVESGGLFYGGLRCTRRNSTQEMFTTTGEVQNCPFFSTSGASVDGRPDDITVINASGTPDEGRVHRFTVPYTFTAKEPCGDGVCDLTEDRTSCPEECSCGNGTCDSDEDVASCPDDCAFCGDDACTPGETRYNCPADCT